MSAYNTLEKHHHSFIKTEFLPNNILMSVRTSQETYYIFITENNWLILFIETINVCYENHMEHKNIFYGHNAKFHCIRECGTYSYHWDTKG
jgi:hypothetical protein